MGVFTLTSSRDVRDWRLEGGGGVFHEADSTLLLWQVRFTTYEEDLPSSVLTSDSGEVLDDGRLLRAWGSARVETSDGRVLTSAELIWDDSAQVFMTDSFAVLQVPDSAGVTTISGMGARLDRSLGSGHGSGIEVGSGFSVVYSGTVDGDI